MNQALMKRLARLGYKHETTEIAETGNVRHRAKYRAIAIKMKDGRVFMAGHLGASEEDAEVKLVKSLERK